MTRIDDDMVLAWWSGKGNRHGRVDAAHEALQVKLWRRGISDPFGKNWPRDHHLLWHQHDHPGFATAPFAPSFIAAHGAEVNAVEQDTTSFSFGMSLNSKPTQKQTNHQRISRHVFIDREIPAILVADTWHGFKNDELKYQQWHLGRLLGANQPKVYAGYIHSMKKNNLQIGNPAHLGKRQRTEKLLAKSWTEAHFFGNQPLQFATHREEDLWQLGSLRIKLQSKKNKPNRISEAIEHCNLDTIGNDFALDDEMDEIIRGDDEQSGLYKKNKATILAVWTFPRGDQRPRVQHAAQGQEHRITIGNRSYTYNGDSIFRQESD
jgi:hypothetical protein